MRLRNVDQRTRNAGTSAKGYEFYGLAIFEQIRVVMVNLIITLSFVNSLFSSLYCSYVSGLLAENVMIVVG
jgi:hypothetical protein